ncbi:MAG TPA: S8 family peptidase [Longimicrobiaceae bacterium]
MLTRNRQSFSAILFCLGLAACSDTPSAPDLAPVAAPASERQAGRAGEPIPDRYVVVFKEGVRDAPGLSRQLAAAHGGTVHHTYQHALKGFAATLPAAAAEALKRNPNVAYVEQDRLVGVAQVGSWGLDRVDQRDLPLNGVYNYPTLALDVTAYVIDTGIHTSHWQFGNRASVGYDALGGNGQDCSGHGTHVAGTIGSSDYGVAKGVNLVAVRVLPCSGPGPSSNVIAGIDWVRYNHATPAVANLSLGGGALQAMDDAIQNLVSSGVTVVVAAGNASDNACYYSPARAPAALTVGATNRYDQQASFSNYGSCVDLYAPGEGITSTWLSSGTNTINGTSMAAPHVAGAAAMYLQKNPSASPAAVGSALLTHATTNRLSALGASSPNRLLYTLLPFVSARITGPDEINATGTYNWQVTATGGDGPYSYQWQYSENYTTWSNVGSNSSSYTGTFNQYGPSFTLRVIVTSGNFSATSFMLHVDRSPPPSPCGPFNPFAC